MNDSQISKDDSGEKGDTNGLDRDCASLNMAEVSNPAHPELPGLTPSGWPRLLLPATSEVRSARKSP